jgi:large subunit ribosomal protein L10
MPNLINRRMASEYEKKFSSLEGAIVVRFEKHTVAHDRDLRRSLRKEKVRYCVVKNRIARRVLGDRLSSGGTDLLRGPVAVAFGTVETTIAAAKVLETARRAKALPGIEVRGGYLDGTLLSVEQIRALTALPSRKELLGLLLSATIAPATNVANLAQAALATPARLIAALIAKKETEKETENEPDQTGPEEKRSEKPEKGDETAGS